MRWACEMRAMQPLIGTLLLLLAAEAVASSGVHSLARRPSLRRSSDIADLHSINHLRGGTSSEEESAKEPDAGAGKVTVEFEVICYSTAPTESVGIVGGCAELGNWNDVVVMGSESWPKWNLAVTMEEPYANIEYKYVKINKDGGVTMWEPDCNR
jgi:hypothetical protein